MLKTHSPFPICLWVLIQNNESQGSPADYVIKNVQYANVNSQFAAVMTKHGADCKQINRVRTGVWGEAGYSAWEGCGTAFRVCLCLLLGLLCFLDISHKIYGFCCWGAAIVQKHCFAYPCSFSAMLLLPPFFFVLWPFLSDFSSWIPLSVPFYLFNSLATLEDFRNLASDRPFN